MVAFSLFAFSLLGSVLAHGDHDEPSDIALFRRNNLNERHEIQKRCGGTLAAIHRRRLARRGYNGPEARGEHIPRAALCSMTGETTEGPYYVNNELFRENVTDGFAGVPLQLHITLLDVATCEIAPSLFVEIWSANSTGSYSGFTTAGGGGGGDGPPGGGNGTGGPPGGPSGTGSASGSMTLPSGSGGGQPQETSSGSGSSTIGPLDGADDPSGQAAPSTASTDNFTFMRGVTQADDKGETTFYANVPGWYSGRAVHIHIRVWENSTVASNGSFISSSGTLHHTGQLYFKQDLVDEIAKLTPYSLNALAYANATRNDEDSIYPYSTAGGYDPDLETTLLGESLEDGVLGEIVITINSTYISPVFSTNYYVADGEEGGDGSSSASSSGTALSSQETDASDHGFPRHHRFWAGWF